jgi:hypothetical protein
MATAGLGSDVELGCDVSHSLRGKPRGAPLMLTLLQDWVTLEGTTTESVKQSASKWLNLEGYCDAIFFLQVSGLMAPSTYLYMSYETAPLNDPTLFTPMVSEFLMSTSSSPAVTTVLLSQNPSCPVAGLVRWSVRQSHPDPWGATFRIHCLGKRKG